MFGGEGFEDWGYGFAWAAPGCGDYSRVFISLSKGEGRGEGGGEVTVYDYNVIFGDYGGELGR